MTSKECVHGNAKNTMIIAGVLLNKSRGLQMYVQIVKLVKLFKEDVSVPNRSNCR